MTAQPTYTVAAVARRIGVAPATLRTWDRRYGMGPSEHAAGAHRRYSDSDVARLERMRHLVITGVPPAEAARLASDGSSGGELATVTPIRGAQKADPAAIGPDTRSSDTLPRPGGGQVVAMPGAAPAVRGLARAAQTLDTHACSAIISTTIDDHGVEWTWSELIAPVLFAVGARWSETGQGIEIEHALSSAVQESLTREISRLEMPINSRSVLLASAPDELHSLPLWALGACLAERGIGARILGARVPTESLIQAAQRTGPAAVFIWSQMSATADYAALAAMPAFRPRVSVVVGGPGWPATAPAGIERVGSLGEAVTAIAHSLGE